MKQAEPPAPSAPIAASELPKKSKMRMRILMTLCVVGALVLKLSFLFFAIGMLPAMVAYLIDHDKNKYVFSTIAALNFAGVFPDLIDLFMRGGTFGAVKTKLSDATVWFTMYSAAGLGWALVWLSPLIAALLLEGIYRGRILHMESLQKKLEEEWGPEVTGKASKEGG